MRIILGDLISVWMVSKESKAHIVDIGLIPALNRARK
jgi:hypothetical protein